MVTTTRSPREAEADLRDLEARAQALRSVFAAVTDKLPSARVRSQFKRLWPRRLGPPSEDDAPDVTALVLETLAFARDPNGRTAFDRAARNPPFAEGMPEAAALELTCRAAFQVFEVEECHHGAPAAVRDMVSGAQATLEPCAVVRGERLAGHFAGVADGTRVTLGGIVRLGPGVWPTAAKQIEGARNRAFRNPERAAEAIYARAIADAVDSRTPLKQIFVQVLSEGPDVESDVPGVRFENGRWRFSAEVPDFLVELLGLAETWARLDSPKPERADPDGARWLRQEVQPDDAYTLAALGDQVSSDSPAARALEAMLRLTLDTVERRAAYGLGAGLAQFEAELPRPGAGLSDMAWQRLQRLRAHLGVSAGERDPALDRVIQRIRALQAKTQAAGCTEAEALAAAQKAEELLRRYDVELTPEQIGRAECTSALVTTPRKRRDALDACADAVARFCGCRHWLQDEADGRLTHVFFGLHADVAAAETLYDIIAETFTVETATFKAGTTYAETPSGQRAQATKSFRYGLARGISDRLAELEAERGRHTTQTTGRDLVPVKRQVIDDALERLGLAFQTTRRRRRGLDPESYHQGVASGRSFQPEPGVHAASGRRG
jgi:hypothetical protein